MDEISQLCSDSLRIYYSSKIQAQTYIEEHENFSTPSLIIIATAEQFLLIIIATT